MCGSHRAAAQLGFPAHPDALALAAAQPLLALLHVALNVTQGLDLLTQRFLSLVALAVEPLVLSRGSLALARQTIGFMRQPLLLGHIGGKERRKAPDAR